MSLHLGSHPLRRSLNPYPPVEIVRNRRHDKDDHERRKQPVGDEHQKRQLEDVEANITAKLRIGGTERASVDEQQPVVPLLGNACTGDDGEKQCHTYPNGTSPPADHFEVTLQQLLLGPRRPKTGSKPVGNDQVDQQYNKEHQGEDHPERDFAPVTLIGTIPFVLTVTPSVPAKSVEELVRLARSKPGTLNYGSGGNSSPGHLITEMFKTRSGTHLVHVPYRSVAQAVTGMLGDQVQVMFTVGPAAVPQLAAGRMRGLAVSTAQRASILPDLPTIAESGFPGFDAPAWNGVLVPAGTPTAIVRQLHGEIVRDLRLAEVQERTRVLGFDLIGNTPEEFGRFIRAELAKWAKVVKDSGVKAE